MKLDCGHELKVKKDDISTGYGTNDKGKKSCYACCAEYDRKTMRKDKKNCVIPFG